MENYRRYEDDKMIQTQNVKRKQKWNNKAIRITASAFGALAGVTGIIAGYFEILQGNAIPSDIWISMIGSNYSMWENRAYDALTVIPSFYITGILALIISSVALIWSVVYIHKKNGTFIMIILAIFQCLVGGGWVLDLGIFTSILATRINSPLNWWRRNLPKRVYILSRLWPLSVLGYAILSMMLLVSTVLGVNNQSIVSMVTPIASAMIIPVPVMIIGGIAYDIKNT